MLQRLFVYGSLRPGGTNAHVLSDLKGEWTRGTVRGRLVDSGWGAALGYPAIVLDDEAGMVPGHVLTSEDLSERWHELDEFEGPGYRRTRTTVQVGGGRIVEAFVYVLRE